MRVWDQIPPSKLCRQHLLGEHREIHAIWTVLRRANRRTLTAGTAGYMNHPEVRRWRGKERALAQRHSVIVREMEARGYEHRTPLSKLPFDGSPRKPKPIDDQLEKLRGKNCDCEVSS